MVVGATLYVVILNPEVQTVYLTRSTTVTTYLGVSLLVAFLAGALFSFFGALWFGLQAYFREQSLKRIQANQKRFFDLFLEARGYIASGEVGKAQSLWEKFIQKASSPELSAMAKLELSRSYKDSKEALKLVDAARITYPSSLEVLFRAAELNHVLGNDTAALDNLALIMYHHPNRKAAKMASELALQLGRTADAKEYQRQYRELGGDEINNQFVADAELKESLASASDEASEIKLLKSHLSRYPDSIFALEELSDLLRSQGKASDAAQYLTQYAEQKKSLAAWREVIELWIEQRAPERALSAARRAKSTVSTDEHAAATLELARLYVSLGMLSDAENELNALAPLETTLPVSVKTLSDLYLASVSLKRGEVKQALEHLDALIRFGKSPEEQSLLQRDAPSPALSTP